VDYCLDVQLSSSAAAAATAIAAITSHRARSTVSSTVGRLLSPIGRAAPRRVRLLPKPAAREAAVVGSPRLYATHRRDLCPEYVNLSLQLSDLALLLKDDGPSGARHRVDVSVSVGVGADVGGGSSGGGVGMHRNAKGIHPARTTFTRGAKAEDATAAAASAYSRYGRGA
jgi:hypothetical protein